MATAVAVARSAPLALTDADGPRKPRVSVLPGGGVVGGATLAKSPAAAPPLAVVWSSGRNSAAMPALRWWLDPASASASAAAPPLVTVVPAKTETYGRAHLCDAPATTIGYRDIGFIHTAVIAGAPHGASVRYQLVDDLGGAYPSEGEPALTLTVPPAAAAAASSGFTVAMFADMGRGTRDDSKTWHEYGSPAINVSASLAADVDAGRVGAAFLFGDLSYAVG